MVELRELTTGEFHDFQELIYQISGIRIPDAKRMLLSNRVRRRLKASGFSDFASYFGHLTSPSGKGELSGFLDAVTTNETSFFRTEKHFEWFRSTFVSELVRQARDGQRPRRLRIWSAACSTGEEPYSIAICLLENQLKLRDWEIKLIATDLNEEVLQTAAAGIYRQRAIEGLDEKRCKRYFQKVKDDASWQIKPNLRAMVSFQRHNLLDRPPATAFDCIFIRNVLIYFDRQSKQTVVDHLTGALARDGYLVVGPSEGIFDMLQGLTKHDTYLYQK